MLALHVIPRDRAAWRALSTLAFTVAVDSGPAADPDCAIRSVTAGGSTTTRKSNLSSRGPETRDAYRARALAPHRHDPGPLSLPHGQGFIAATRMTFAGKTMLARARHTSTHPSSSGCLN